MGISIVHSLSIIGFSIIGFLPILTSSRVSLCRKLSVDTLIIIFRRNAYPPPFPVTQKYVKIIYVIDLWLDKVLI